jgi:hypothetical protein
MKTLRLETRQSMQVMSVPLYSISELDGWDMRSEGCGNADALAMIILFVVSPNNGKN